MVPASRSIVEVYSFAVEDGRFVARPVVDGKLQFSRYGGVADVPLVRAVSVKKGGLGRGATE